MVYNGLSQFNELFFKKHNVKLNNGYGLQMFSNYVNMYNMPKKVDEITKKSNEKLVPIIKSIREKENGKIKRSNALLNLYYSKVMKNVPSLDKHYNINSNCTSCGICKEICPVKNIEIENGKPKFRNNCEQCVACIQYCPHKAINYKNLTQKRRRYTNPEINYKELSEMNKK
jgi:ferredoxin